MRLGQIDSVVVKLAEWLPAEEQYQRRYIPVDPQTEYVASERFGLTSDLQTRTWIIRDWSGGEGEYTWDRELKSFREGDTVAPVQIGEGIELAPYAVETFDTTGAALFDDSDALGFAQGSLWTAFDSDAYEWDWSGEKWGDAITTGGTTNQCMSIADGEDTWVYSAHFNKAIHRWKSGSNQTHVATTVFTNWPILVNFEGALFALDGNDLYEIDKTAADTRTLVGSVGGTIQSGYLSNAAYSRNRLWTSDVGPIWISLTEDFESHVWEYNVASDTTSRLAKLPSFITPTSIFYAQGFVFVGFQQGPTGTADGRSYLWYGRGAQKGIIGPIRATSDGGAVYIAGTFGDDLLFTHQQSVWAYNMTSGGVVRLGQPPSTALGHSLRMFGSKLFAGGSDGASTSNSVVMYDFNEHANSGYFYTGWFDFDYPAMDKILLDVTVLTDPLPANTTVDVAYSTDAGSTYTTAAGSLGAGETKKTWQIGGVGVSAIGKTFELKVLLGSTAVASTPTVREVSARATGVAHRIEWTLAVDCSTDKSGTQDSQTMISNLIALAAAQQVHTFVDPWTLKEHNSPNSYYVTLEEVILPKVQEKTNPVAYVRMRTVDLV